MKEFMHKLVSLSTIIGIVTLTSVSFLKKAQADIPSGSYRQTCRNIALNGNILTATCVGPRGSLYDASLDISKCGDEVTNHLGTLVCPLKGSLAPRGSYQYSCVNIVSQGYIVKANCRVETGVWRETSIDASTCVGDITNKYGRLECVKNGNSNSYRGYNTYQFCVGSLYTPAATKVMYGNSWEEAEAYVWKNLIPPGAGDSWQVSRGRCSNGL
jgi:hypothetical protein